MKTKLLLLIVTLFSFAASCEPEEVQQTPQEETCECRKSYYTNQVVNYGFQFVWTHDGPWEQVPLQYREMGVFQWNTGNYLSGFINYQDDDHAYRWECKPE